MALPLLEAMMTQTVSGATNAAMPKRLGIFYFGTGMNMREFEPRDEGKDYTLSPTLQVVQNHKDDFTVFSGTYLEHGGGHDGDYTFSTGVKAKDGGSINNSVSMDQIAAEQLGRETRFPSLQMCVQRGTGFGGNLRTLSWNRNGVPLASENDPHVMFNRLFKVDGPEERELRKKGYRCFHRASDPSGADGGYCRVFVGPLPSVEMAAEVKERLEQREGYKDILIRSVGKKEEENF